MLKIRLARVGKKKQPAYRMVVADSRSPRDGAFVEIIGHYDPLQDPAALVVDEDKAVGWLQKGAQPSDTAARLLSGLGVLEKAGLPPLPVPKPKAKKPKIKKSEADVEAKPEADVEAKPEADAEAKPEADAEAKPEADAEAKPEADAEAKPEADASKSEK